MSSSKSFHSFFFKSARLSLQWILAVILCLVMAGGALAQSTASLSGTVSDPTGAAIPGATVAVRNLATGVEFKTQTDSAGAYLFPTLLIGARIAWK
jgi:hypothetical protein